MDYTWTLSTSDSALSSCPFRILAFTGKDDICQGYCYDILLIASNVTEDTAPTILQKMAEAANLTLTGSTTADSSFSFAWSGMPERVEAMFPVTESRATNGGGSSSNGYVLRVLLRPHSFKLRLGVHSRIFLEAPAPRLLENLLAKEGLASGTDFLTDKLQGSYQTRPISCQYNESSFDFLLRHLERVGGYSYIEQNSGKDRLVLADGAAQIPPLPGPGGKSDLTWNPGQGNGMVVYSFARSMATSPTSITLRDYSTEKPGSESGAYTPQGSGKGGAAPLRGGGTANWYGLFNMFGETDMDAYSAEAAQAQANLMAEAGARALVNRSNRIRGQSTVAWMRPGYSFTLSGNVYQLLSVHCACNCCMSNQDFATVNSAAGLGFTFDTNLGGYGNSFVCHPLDLGPFAPEISVPRPVVNGLIHAVICSPPSAGGYADLDDKGRYSVRFPFAEAVYDASNTPLPGDSGIPLPLRMMQIHAGQVSGVHFPLLDNAEVLVAFSDGDPDRPVILGALPNPENPSVVTGMNSRQNVIKTPQGLSLIMQDDAGANRQVTLTSAQGHSLTMKDDIAYREVRLISADAKNYIRFIEEKQ